MHLHSVLAVSESGVPLGLLEEKMWVREKARRGKGERERRRKIEEKEYQVLDVAVKHRKKPLPEKAKLREGIRAIAILGGFLGRKGDGEPGVKTLWRGWQRLQDMIWGWQIMKNY